MIRIARWLALLAWAGLIAFWFARAVGLGQPPQVPRALLLIFHVGPLLFPLRGLLDGRPYTHAWASFLALWYFVLSVDDIAGGLSDRLLGAIGLGLATSAFVACVAYARLEGRRRKIDGQTNTAEPLTAPSDSKENPPAASD